MSRKGLEYDQKLVPSLKLKCTKSIDVPSCIHGFIIGKNGSNLKKIVSNFPRIKIHLDSSTNKLIIVGPKDEVNIVENKIMSYGIKCIGTHMDMNIDKRYVGLFKGGNRSTIKVLEEETGAHAFVSDNGFIHIHGSKKSVSSLENKIKLIISENSYSKSINLSETCYQYITACNNRILTKIKNQFSTIYLATVEDMKQMVLTGTKYEVNNAYEEINKEYIEKFIQMEFMVDINKLGIIGKGGVNIKHLQSETGVVIKIENNLVILQGAKDSLLRCKDMIKEIEFGKKSNKAMSINSDLYNYLMYFYEQLIVPILKKYKNEVDITFLPNANNVKCSFVGYKKCLNEAFKEFKLLVDKYNDQQIEMMHVSQEINEHDNDMITEISDSTGTVIQVELSEGNITIIGKRDFVLEAKKKVLAFIENMND